MLRRLRIHGYKSLDGVDIDFGDLTVVVGPNAAGKSNLLDAINLLGRLGTTGTLNEAFQGHRGNPIEAFRVGPGGLSELVGEKESAQFTLSADIELSPAVTDIVDGEIGQMREGLPDSKSRGAEPRRWITERRLRYEVTIEIRTSTGLLRVLDERIAALNSKGELSQGRKPFLERMGSRLSLRMEGQAHPTYFDLGLDHTVLSRPLYAPHYPHITALREELRRWHVFYFDPAALRSDAPLKQTTAISSRGADLPAFVRTLSRTQPNDFRSFVQALKFVIPSIEDVEAVTTEEGFLSLVVTEAGSRFSARVVSEGTLRVLGLLSITQRSNASALVAYEEPENGVHPRRLELIAEVLRRSAARKHVQIVVNTQSPVLPGFLGASHMYAASKVRGKTQFRRIPEGLFERPEIDSALAETEYQRRVMSGEFGG